jgi:tripartite-type tricarboxylate transporter receptor subunit TctC
MRRSTWISLLLALGCCGTVIAQSYPSRPIRAIYPLTPGGLGDIVLRAVGAELTRTLGTAMVVENRAGANTIIGAEQCARAPADGYTICLLAVDTLTINPFLYRKLPYDSDKDFAPITNLFFLTEGFMVNPSLPAKSVTELIALARTRPGTLNYGSPANLVVMFMESFNKEVATDVKMIPYKGGGDAVNALVSGEVQVGFFGIGNLIGQLKSGKVRLLAVDSPARSPLFPEVPTLAEAGYHGNRIRAWFGFLAPAGTPAAAVAKLNAEIARVVKEPEFMRKHITELGLEAILDSPGEFRQYMREDRLRAEILIKQSGIPPLD